MYRPPQTVALLRGAAAALAAALLLLPAPPAGATAFESAERCRECHRQIYDQWKGSHHASAFTHPDFQVPYERLRKERPSLAGTCAGCHDPMRSVLPGGGTAPSPFAPEGVTCDFCHSVESVATSGPYPRAYSLQPGVKFGRRGEYQKKTVHVTRPSRLLVSSAFCAGCHEFRNSHDVPVLTTVSEWEGSFYKGEGIHCQFCHLPELFDARFVEGDKGQRKGPADHAMVGGHSQERLARAIPMRASLSAVSGGAEVVVRLRNETVGHMTPSGMPHHRIRLRSTLYDAEGKALGTREELFQRLLGDGKGKALSRPEEFLDAREVLSDNRIAPKEERVVRHRFALEGGRAAVAAEASLVYEFPTYELGTGMRTFEIPIAKSTVTLDAGVPWKTLAIVAGAVAAALLAILWATLRGRKDSPPP